MTKIYRTTDNNYVAIVAHDHDLLDEEGYEYFGAFEYSIGLNVGSGEWELYIYDLAEEEPIEVDNLFGINGRAVAELVNASRGEVEFEDMNLMGTDYYGRIDRLREVLSDDVLMEAIAAEYHGRD